MITLYGIKNCDTVKKARRWLEQAGIDYRFHDFRDDGVTREAVVSWIDELGWEALVNRRSTSWKQLAPSQREAMNAETAVDAILEQPTLIKRPLLDVGHERLTGFSPAQYEALFEKHTL